MFSLTKTAVLALAAALTASAAPAPDVRDQITTTVRALGVSDNIEYAGYHACGTVTGAVVPVGGQDAWTPGCPSLFTVTGSDETGYTVATANGPCGFVGGIFRCAAGVKQAHFDGGSSRSNADPQTAIYTSGGWSWAGNTLFEDKTVAHPVTIKLENF